MFERISRKKADEIASVIYNSARRYLLAFIYTYEPISFSDLKGYFMDPPEILEYHIGRLIEAELITNSRIKEDGEFRVTESGLKLLELTKVLKKLDALKQEIN